MKPSIWYVYDACQELRILSFSYIMLWLAIDRFYLYIKGYVTCTRIMNDIPQLDWNSPGEATQRIYVYNSHDALSTDDITATKIKIRINMCANLVDMERIWKPPK